MSAWRQVMGLGRRDAAQVLGVSVRQWRRYERGEDGGRLLPKHCRRLLELLVSRCTDTERA